MFVVRASARTRRTGYGLKAALQTPRFIRLKCYPTGNGVPNASFELALERDWRSRHVRPTADETRPFHGGRSLRWDLDGQADQLVTRLIEFGGQGKPFTLELAARAEGSATIAASVWPAAMVGASGPLLRLEAVPKADWGVFRSTGPLPSNRNGAYFLSIDVRPKGKARVWLDAVRLAPGDGSDPFRSSKPIEASLACPKLAHIHREGEAVRLEVRAYNDTGEARTLELACRVADYWRRPVAKVPVRLSVGARSGCSTLITLPVRSTGVYLAELVRGDETLGELSFSVLPPVSAVPAERSVVGGHFRLDEFHLRVANAMGIKWTRIHDCESLTHCATVEPEKGRFEWFSASARGRGMPEISLAGIPSSNASLTESFIQSSHCPTLSSSGWTRMNSRPSRARRRYARAWMGSMPALHWAMILRLPVGAMVVQDALRIGRWCCVSQMLPAQLGRLPRCSANS